MAKTSFSLMGTYSKDLLVCLLPRVSMIKQYNSNVTINARDLTYNHSFKKFCMRNTLTNHEESLSNPSCKPSNEREHHNMPRTILHKSCASLPRAIIPRQKTKMYLSQESELCYVKMRGNVLYLYHPNDL
jgi:hypothetical protein